MAQEKAVVDGVDGPLRMGDVPVENELVRERCFPLGRWTHQCRASLSLHIVVLLLTHLLAEDVRRVTACAYRAGNRSYNSVCELTDSWGESEWDTHGVMYPPGKVDVRRPGDPTLHTQCLTQRVAIAHAVPGRTLRPFRCRLKSRFTS